MKTNGIRAFVLGPALFVAAVGLALSASGCVIDPGPGYDVSCQSDLFVQWQIQNESGAAVTCAGAGAATVTINIDGAPYPQKCTPDLSEGGQDIPLQQNNASYDVTVSLYDAGRNPLAVPQEITINVGGCGSYSTPSPALLVVTPPTP
jgi:hypothetical protein